MDIKIENGDFAMSDFFRPVVIFDDDELMQRINNRLKIKKGSVFLKDELGSNLHLLTDCSDDELQSQAEEYVREALEPLKCVTVNAVSAKRKQNGIFIRVDLQAENDNKIFEVNI